MEWRAGEDQGDLGSVFSENLQSQTTVPGSVCQFTACERTGRVRARLVPAAPVWIWQSWPKFPGQLGKSLQLLGIKAAELSCLRGQMPVADKLAERDLFCLGSSLIIKGCFFCIFFPERAWQYHEADTDGGSSSLEKEPI